MSWGGSIGAITPAYSRQSLLPLHPASRIRHRASFALQTPTKRPFSANASLQKCRIADDICGTTASYASTSREAGAVRWLEIGSRLNALVAGDSDPARWSGQRLDLLAGQKPHEKRKRAGSRGPLCRRTSNVHWLSVCHSDATHTAIRALTVPEPQQP